MGMMWTTENRPRYNRDKLRYPSDLANEEWGHFIYPASIFARSQKTHRTTVA